MSTKESVTFTARDLTLIAAALASMKQDPVIDYAKFATNGGFKNANSAKASWHGLKKKIDKLAGGASIGGVDSPAKASTGTTDSTKRGGKKRTAAGEDDNEDNATASKPKVKRGRKNASDEEETIVVKTTVKDDPEDAKTDENGVKAEEEVDNE